jgi:outer membrane protein assembly factor BamB
MENISTGATFAQGHEMRLGQTLKRQSLTSPSGEFTLVHQDDGNLVLYRDADGRALWTSGTGGSGTAGCVLGPDGELTVYAKNGQPVWSSGTSGHSGSRLLVHDDGRVVLRTDDGTDVWHRPLSEDAPAAAQRRVPRVMRPKMPTRPPAQVAMARILAQLDDCVSEYRFPDLNHGYFYAVDARMHLFSDTQRWALIVETLGYNPALLEPRQCAPRLR